MASLASRLAKWAAKPMRPGEGLHTDFFRAAILMMEEGHPDEGILPVLRAAADRVSDRAVPDRELRGAIASARARFNGGALESVQWPAFSPELRAELTGSCTINLAELAAAAEEQPRDTGHFLRQLFQPGEFVCLGETAYSFLTMEREHAVEFVASRRVEYVNPNPMTAALGLTKDGKISAHCLDNCGPKTYQVVEFDSGTVHDHVALHWWLAKLMPLILLCYSGGKSVHGWYDVQGRTEDEIRKFFGCSISVGSDPKMWSRCQFSRLPGGWNTKHRKPQEVIFFSPTYL